MEINKCVKLLEKQIEDIQHIKQQERYSSSFYEWYRYTQVIIEKIFGLDTRHLRDFTGISYSLNFSAPSVTEYDRRERYNKGLAQAQVTLKSMINELNEFGLNNSVKVDEIELIKNLCSKFHLIARQLRVRHNNRATLEIEDEYDVQDLFHALLLLHFTDIRHEEWTPSYAGGSSRVDFLLKNEKIIVEIKKTRKNLSAKDIGDQLIIDSKKYQAHPDCKILICFVYDPEGRIGNPKGLENDLYQKNDGFEAIVIIVPTGM